MKFLKIINLTIFIIFFIFIVKYYLSNDFLEKKKLARDNYLVFLKKQLAGIKNIESKKNFKEFQDNSEYLKKNTEEKKFWQLLKTK